MGYGAHDEELICRFGNSTQEHGEGFAKPMCVGSFLGRLASCYLMEKPKSLDLRHLVKDHSLANGMIFLPK